MRECNGMKLIADSGFSSGGSLPTHPCSTSPDTLNASSGYWRAACRSIVFAPPSSHPVNQLVMNSGNVARRAAFAVGQTAFLVLVMLRVVMGAPAEDLISSLPGQPSVTFKQYGGFVTVDSNNGRALYYYFVEAETNAATKPLTLWLNGGPGCSSLTGAFTELGSFYTLNNSLVRNTEAWNKVSNVLFLESPAGVGFSYSNTSSDYTTGDVKTAQDSLTFLLEWFKKFPEYGQRDFYITGESYTGHYGPQLASAVLKNNAVAGQPQIQLKGLMVGNPLFDAVIDTLQAPVVYLWSHGAISQATFDAIHSDCKLDGSQESVACDSALNDGDTQAANSTAFNPYDVISDVCLSSASTVATRQLKTHVYNKLGINLAVSSLLCISDYETNYLNLPDVQHALHATNIEWFQCSNVLNYSSDDELIKMLPVLKDLATSGLRLWIFSGDEDSIIPLIGTGRIVNQVAKDLGLTSTSPYRVWFQGQQIGGWTQTWENLTIATVRGAGHMVPATQPARALQLFTSFISGTSLPSQ